MLRTLAELTAYRKSYRAGLLQARAFRVLKKRTNDVLAPHDLNASDWGILGLLIDHPKGLAQKQIATEVGVKPPLVTRALAKLQNRHLVSLMVHPDDSRVRVVSITKQGRSFVDKIEKDMTTMLYDTFDGISQRDRLGYVKTLLAINKRFGDEMIGGTDLDHLQDD